MPAGKGRGSSRGAKSGNANTQALPRDQAGGANKRFSPASRERLERLSEGEIRFEAALAAVLILHALAQTYNVFHWSWLHNTNWTAMAFLCVVLCRRLLQAAAMAPLAMPKPPATQRHRSARQAQAAAAAHAARVAGVQRNRKLSIVATLLVIAWITFRLFCVLTMRQLLHMFVPIVLHFLLIEFRWGDDEDSRESKAGGGGGSGGAGGEGVDKGRQRAGSKGDGVGVSASNGAGANGSLSTDTATMLLEPEARRSLLRGWSRAVFEGLLLAYTATVVPTRLTPHHDFFFYWSDCALVTASCTVTTILLLRVWTLATSTYPFVPIGSVMSLDVLSVETVDALKCANAEFEDPADDSTCFSLLCTVVAAEVAVLVANGLLAVWQRHWAPCVVGAVCAEGALLVMAPALFAYRSRLRQRSRAPPSAASVSQ